MAERDIQNNHWVLRQGADVFDYIEKFYNLRRQHSTLGHLSPAKFEKAAGLA